MVVILLKKVRGIFVSKKSMSKTIEAKKCYIQQKKWVKEKRPKKFKSKNNVVQKIKVKKKTI